MPSENCTSRSSGASSISALPPPKNPRTSPVLASRNITRGDCVASQVNCILWLGKYCGLTTARVLSIGTAPDGAVTRVSSRSSLERCTLEILLIVSADIGTTKEKMRNEVLGKSATSGASNDKDIKPCPSVPSPCH